MATKPIQRLFLLWIGLHTWSAGVKTSAQSSKIYQIPQGTIATSVIPPTEIFRYATFQKAAITYPGGTMPGVTLNYNRLYAEMQFIDTKGDTLALANEDKIKLIDTGENVFYFVPDVGFVELVANLPLASLVRQESLEIMDKADLVKNTGFQNGFTGTGAGTYVGSAPNYRQLFARPAPQDMRIRKQVRFMVMDHNKRFYPVKKATLVQLFPRHKREINHYWATEKSDVKNEKDLIEFLEFCNQLRNPTE